MSDDTPPKAKRPALTSAERRQDARDRVEGAMWEPALIAELPDSLLLEAIGLAFRKNRSAALVEATRELFDRRNARDPGGPIHLGLVYNEADARASRFARLTRLKPPDNAHDILLDRNAEQAKAATDAQLDEAKFQD
ncbi:hypothetical protein HW932_18570 [Allochromatium humboldtianum]|uniref:Uncharacterized protein n=1 Tax=Allochromatium humboldtianum TaxID=504901 RepID=A0A850RD40_9GAMM|nr:hypothetical protein [Allochromatium humboldtianum]NVZ11258.1 hypothetical protein [Allochromatium humboldtianum]